VNEFEWRRQLRDLRQPLPPQRDLWGAIEGALTQPSPIDAATATAAHRTAPPRRWLGGCAFFNLSAWPRMASHGSVKQVADSRERVRARLGRAIEESHRKRFSSQALNAAALAASVLLVAALAWHRLHDPASTQLASAPAQARPWNTAAPPLAGATIELDAARMELRQAIEQAPDSAALQRLLARTERQQTELRDLAHGAG
jgi:hypothetical protein